MGRVRIINAQAVPGEIWFSPGKNASLLAELWNYDGIADPVLVWTAPADYSITCLLPYNGTTMFVVCSEGVSTGYLYNMHYIYEVTVGGTATLRATYYTADLAEGEYGCEASSAAELGGQFYISHVSRNEYPRAVVRFNPVTYAITQVCTTRYTYDVYNQGFGGIGLLDSTLYWCSGQQIWSSSDGTSWSMIADLGGPLSSTLDYDSNGFVSAGSGIYWGSVYSANYTYYRRIKSIVGGSVGTDYTAGALNNRNAAAVAVRNIGGTLLALTRSVSGGLEYVDIWSKASGAWASIATITDAVSLSPTGGQASIMLDSLYFFVTAGGVAGTPRLYKMTTGGTVTLIQAFTGYRVLNTGIGGQAPITNLIPTKKVQEV